MVPVSGPVPVLLSVTPLTAKLPMQIIPKAIRPAERVSVPTAGGAALTVT